VVRLYETEDRSMLRGDAEGLFIKRTLVSVEKHIENYLLGAQSTNEWVGGSSFPEQSAQREAFYVPKSHGGAKYVPLMFRLYT